MIPTLIPIEHGGIIVFNCFIIVAWLVFSFLFWRGLRAVAVEEDRIFDLTFYATMVAFVASRFGFVVSHWELFSGKSPLLTVALWVSPGLSWVSALIGGLLACVFLSRQYKIRLGHVLDTLAAALPLPVILGKAGSLLTGIESGVRTTVPWIQRDGTSLVIEHPVQLYEMLVLVVISIVVLRLGQISVVKKWPYGIVGIWFLLLYATGGFALEFLKDSRVYWSTLTANQWMLIGIFAECVGVLYVRGGGRERLRPFAHKTIAFIQEKGKKFHESISKRHPH